MKTAKYAALLTAFFLVLSLFACKAQNKVTVSSDTSASVSPQSSSQAASSTESAKASSLPGSGTVSGVVSSSGTVSQTNSSSQSAASVNSPSTYSKKPVPSSTQAASSKAGGSGTVDWDRGGTYTGSIQINTPVASGTVVYQQGGSCIDASNASCGYVMVKQSGSSKRLKVIIKKSGASYNYDLNHDGSFETYPLQMGSGGYTVRIMENVSGSSYIELLSADINVNLSSSLTPYLYPNQFVNYTASSSAVRKAFGLCMNAHTDLDKVKSIYNYIINNISYDTYKASTVTSGYLPNVNSALSSQRGICFDYAALMACMLRSQGVPAKLVVGTVSPNNANHAWNEVYIQNRGWITLKIQVTGAGWKRMDSTFGAARTATIENFIGNGSNYTSLRYY
ncbi:MAG TPA: transglutaminase-like domain-containing protein [Oscillospiraceae bacterium]|nr:transglutaminase-like domain-containing protein [Oscillospiraceae bacterium]